MFTERVLQSIQNPELRQALHLNKGDTRLKSRLDWIKDKVSKIPSHDKATNIDLGPNPENESLQQSDLLRKFYLSIAVHSLKYAYDHANGLVDPSDLPHSSTNDAPQAVTHSVEGGKHVIIVGAGISGLVAAYELKKVGYKVEILEMSQRCGGRIKTLTQKDGYDRGLYTDAGAMRLPLPPKKDRRVCDMIHYLPDYYAEIRFNLKPVPFSNHSDNAFYTFYGETTKISDWTDAMFSRYWPGWDNKAKEQGITSLITYYEKTAGVVTGLLEKRLKGIPREDIAAQAEQWDLWTNNWCQFSLGSFLRNTVDSIKDLFKPDDKITKNDLDDLEKYLPWPEISIIGYIVFTYTLSEDVSLTSVLVDEMGKYLSAEMHTLEGGLSALPNAFAGQGKIEPLITYNRTVNKVEYTYEPTSHTKCVKVSGVITSSDEPFSVTGRSVILTVPLPVLRGIQIVNSDSTDKTQQFPREFQQAIEDIRYSPSTKIMLQYKEQFWNTGKNSSTDITGGLSITNLPIGQLYYPTQVLPAKLSNVDSADKIEPLITEKQKGILMVYTWKAEALLWGALSEEQAIRLAVQQVDELHPGIDTKALFEVGKRLAWASDPTALGAFANLRPREYISVTYIMQHSWRNVYFSGEAISFTNAWIQGALESGLRAAYQLYSDDQPTTS